MQVIGRVNARDKPDCFLLEANFHDSAQALTQSTHSLNPDRCGRHRARRGATVSLPPRMCGILRFTTHPRPQYEFGRRSHPMRAQTSIGVGSEDGFARVEPLSQSVAMANPPSPHAVVGYLPRKFLFKHRYAGKHLMSPKHSVSNMPSVWNATVAFLLLTHVSCRPQAREYAQLAHGVQGSFGDQE